MHIYTHTYFVSFILHKWNHVYTPLCILHFSITPPGNLLALTNFTHSALVSKQKQNKRKLLLHTAIEQSTEKQGKKCN